jgi:hypothetical protein
MNKQRQRQWGRGRRRCQATGAFRQCVLQLLQVVVVDNVAVTFWMSVSFLKLMALAKATLPTRLGLGRRYVVHVEP